MPIRTFCSIAVLAFSLTAFAQSAPGPTLSQDPIPAQQMSIYRDFLSIYANGSNAKLNIAQTTSTFRGNDMGTSSSCLSGFDVSKVPNITHAFAANAFPANKATLVDPAQHQRRDPGDAIRRGQSVDDAVNAGFSAALFTFSEIIFDSTHTHAAFNYSFVCGSLCGHGGTEQYELVDGKWKHQKNDNFCGQWIS